MNFPQSTLAKYASIEISSGYDSVKKQNGFIVEKPGDLKYNCFIERKLVHLEGFEPSTLCSKVF